MPTRRQRLAACVFATCVALAGCGGALAFGLLVAFLFSDDGTLSGLIEGFLAGGLVLAATPIASVVAVRWWAGRDGTVVPGWGWATLAVATGGAAAFVVLALSNAVGPPGTTPGVLVMIAVTAVVGGAAADRVLAVWAARSPSRG